MESRVAAQINRFRKEAGQFEQKNCEFSAKVLRGGVEVDSCKTHAILAIS
jgi:hypothetical protein